MSCSKEEKTLFLYLYSRFVSVVAVFTHFGISALTLFLATFDLYSQIDITSSVLVSCFSQVPEINSQGLDLLSCDFMSGSWGHWVL